MTDQKMRLELRQIKFTDYIRRKPDSPFGYYGLGVQYMQLGKPAQADRMFERALKIDGNYLPAMLGKLEFLLTGGRFLAACRYYRKNRQSFSGKKVYLKRVQGLTSQLYRTRSFFRHTRSLRSMVAFSKSHGPLQRMFDNEPDNPVVNLLLAMFFLKNRQEDERARVIYNLCVRMEGIGDKLRWDLLQSLSAENPAILQDDEIAGMFNNIPEGAYGKQYASFLLSRFMQQQDKNKVLKAFSDLHKHHFLPDRKTLWLYLRFCRERNLWNPSMLACCQKLMASGWVDGFVAKMVEELKNRGMAENTRELDRLLNLYGYQ